MFVHYVEHSIGIKCQRADSQCVYLIVSTFLPAMQRRERENETIQNVVEIYLIFISYPSAYIHFIHCSRYETCQ
jgi:hypothetical protein